MAEYIKPLPRKKEFPKDTLPAYLTENAATTGYIKKFYETLWEIDLLITAYHNHRQLQESIIELYENKKGIKYEKAQRAAIAGDEDVECINKLMKRRRKLLNAFQRWWGIYVGNKKYGSIVCMFLATGGDEVILRKKWTQCEINAAMQIWWAFCEKSKCNAVARYEKHKQVNKGLKKMGYWWLEEIN